MTDSSTSDQLNDLVATLRESIARRMLTIRRSESEVLVSTHLSLEDQTPVSLVVTQVGDDLFVVSDAGLAADALGDVGVDLSRPAAWRSFKAVKDLPRYAPAVGVDLSKYEIAVGASSSDLGDAMIDVSEAVLRAEFLRAIGSRHRPRSFRDRVVRTAHQIGLTVVPKAPIPLRYAGATRQVNYLLSRDDREAYVQLVSRASTRTSYDHAKSLFSDADIPREKRVAAIEANADIAEWQQKGLEEVATVVWEGGIESFLSHELG